MLSAFFVRTPNEHARSDLLQQFFTDFLFSIVQNRRKSVALFVCKRVSKRVSFCVCVCVCALKYLIVTKDDKQFGLQDDRDGKRGGRAFALD